MPHKPVRLGFKAFVLCDSETGYLLEWRMHNKQENSSTTKAVVLDLLAMFEDINVCMDKYYSTTEIFEDLETCQNIGACGTINQHRCKLSPEMKDEIEQLENEKALFYIHEALQLCVWRTHKGKLVYVISTIHDNAMVKSQRFCLIKRERIQIERPQVLEEYNRKVRGVDFFFVGLPNTKLQ